MQESIGVLKKRLLLIALFIIFTAIALVSFLILSSKLPLPLTPRVPDNEVMALVPEGTNVRQIGKIMENIGLFTAEEFVRTARDHEGYLFPDTYRFFKKTTPEEVVAKMRKNFDAKITAISGDLGKEGKTLEEVIIMASILEKEVRHPEDMKIVSGILWKRYKIGMALQVDATLDYILGKASHELTEDDLKFDSPYNTYLYPGLPAGPISNPGMDTILAALHPSPSRFLYYLSDNEGNIHYAATFEQHKQNKFRYLRRQ